MAVDAESGRILWSKETRVSPLTLASGGSRILFHDGEKVVCLDRTDGSEAWHSEPVERRQFIPFNFGPKLVFQNGVVLCAGGDRKVEAFDLETGQKMWEAPHPRGGYQSPEDLLVVNGLVWAAPTTSGRDSGVWTGRDLMTGEVKIEFPPDVDTYWFHHRCYIAKATDRFIMPSRTGIEFVNLTEEHWDINHWVRGGCLYGVLPSNGLTYAPPHDCSCYPEAKLSGFNALAPSSAGRNAPAPGEIDDEARLERGPAYEATLTDSTDPADWPTYRHDPGRTGSTGTEVPADLSKAWEKDLGGRLSSVVVGGGRLFVAQVDAHAVHAFDAAKGDLLWTFTAGGRVDSPPTVAGGRVLFGSADGWVYCVRAEDGALIWRFRAAPVDRRLMAFEQVESVWPVHGSVLVEGDYVYTVAGRSNFLDGGLRFLKLEVATGKKAVETVVDEVDPDTGENIQDRIATLQMPTGLADILSSDNDYVFMRSQKFFRDGTRGPIGPNSGDPAKNASVQAGTGTHLFAPFGFTDDSWFHRSYWVFGQSFSGGHNGYYQAAKYAPAGRILVVDDKNVYGFGRKPEYLRWTTTMEHQLFSAPKEPPSVDPSSQGVGGGPGPQTAMIRFEKSQSLDPTGKPLAVEAWVQAGGPNGVILSRGGPAEGFALYITGGRPAFAVRVGGKLDTVTAKKSILGGEWVHLAGVLTENKRLQLYIDGELAADAPAPNGFLTSDPAQTMEIGADDGGFAGDYPTPSGFSGLIDEVRLFHGVVTADEIRRHAADPRDAFVEGAALVLGCSFDTGSAKDESGFGNHGTMAGAEGVEGKFGVAMKFESRSNARQAATLVQHNWTRDVPMLVRAMVEAGPSLFICGPPDLVDEEVAFEGLTQRDPATQALLAEQDAALLGSQGSVLMAVSTEDGHTLSETKLDGLPSWDALIAAEGRLYLTTEDGRILCLSGR